MAFLNGNKISEIGQSIMSRFTSAVDGSTGPSIADAGNIGIGAAKDIGYIGLGGAIGVAGGATAGALAVGLARDEHNRYGSDATGFDDGIFQGAMTGMLAGAGIAGAIRAGKRIYQGISLVDNKLKGRAGEEFRSAI
jgi:hypothetical protein